jgi:acyl-CoA hydrolase
MQPEHANLHGAVHGGVVMKAMDEAGAICAMRYARKPCVTVCVDSMYFHSPVHVGNLLRCRARVTWTGKTSLEIWIRVETEDLIRGEVIHTHSAFAVYVALDEAGRPSEVPLYTPNTPEERRLLQDALLRQQTRLQARR